MVVLLRLKLLNKYLIIDYQTSQLSQKLDMVLLLDQFYQQKEKIGEPIQKKKVYSRLFSVLVHFHQRQ